MVIGQALEQQIMLDLGNRVLGQCWDVCYENNLTKAQLVEGTVDDSQQKQMDACRRKCIARHFEVLKLMIESREIREKEAQLGLAPGSLRGQ